MTLHPLIAQRFSSRSYDPTARITPDQLLEIIDAGRHCATWAATYPVRFTPGAPGFAPEVFDSLLALLAPGNVAWVPHASAAILMDTTVEKTDGTPYPYGFVDAGIALANMTIQAEFLGFNAHPVAGFDTVQAQSVFNIPKNRMPLVILVIGTVADPAIADPELLARDRQPRVRPELQDIVFSPRWGETASFVPQGTV